jgi:ankyrin repeat protein
MRAALNTRTLQVLLSHGAVLNAQRWDDGSTPLYTATSANDRSVVELLCRSGAAVNMGRRVQLPRCAGGGVTLSKIEDEHGGFVVWNRYVVAVVTPVR